MTDTKERILQTALRLFARDGYEAVSVSRIADELGLTKGALYRHYESKRAIFDSILARMEAADAEGAASAGLPTGTAEQTPEAYRAVAPGTLCAYCEAQFRRWTEEPFPAAFRRLLTLEQYRSPEMAALFQQYLGAGPLGYLEDILRENGAEQPALDALALYAPMYLLYGVFDAAENKTEALARLRGHLRRCEASAMKERKNDGL